MKTRVKMLKTLAGLQTHRRGGVYDLAPEVAASYLNSGVAEKIADIPEPEDTKAAEPAAPVEPPAAEEAPKKKPKKKADETPAE